MVASAPAYKRAKSRRGRRILLAREPQLKESARITAIIRGHQTSERVNHVLQDLCLMQKPFVTRCSRRNLILPFEASGEAPLEALLKKRDASAFVLGNHTRKRPDNIIIGRLYNGHIFDMVEFGVSDLECTSSFKATKKSVVGSKPLVCFCGDFTLNESLSRIRSLFLDVFSGEAELEQVDLGGLERVLSVELLRSSADGSADNALLLLRNSRILLKKSGGKLPRVELEEMGPSMKLTVRRIRLASDDIVKEAMKRPRPPKKTANVSKKSALGDTVGKLHVNRQELGNLALRKVKALQHQRSSDET